MKLLTVKVKREELLKYNLIPGKFDVKIKLKVYLTSIERVNIFQKYLYIFTRKFIIIDEAHKIKIKNQIFLFLIIHLIGFKLNLVLINYC